MSTDGMGLKTDLSNGVISLTISLAVTAALTRDDDGPWSRGELLAAVGITSFLSGYFTSLFAK